MIDKTLLDEFGGDDLPELKITKRINIKTELKQVAAAVDAVVKAGADITQDYDSWLRVGFAFASLGEDGREFYHQVSALHPDYKPEETERKFNTLLKDYRGDITIGTFYQACKDAGVKLPKPKKRLIFYKDFLYGVDQQNDQEVFEKVWKYAQEDEVGGADLLAIIYKDTVRYDFTIKKWRYFEDGIWQVDETDRFINEAARPVKVLYGLAAKAAGALQIEAAQMVDEAKEKEYRGKVKSLVGLIKKMNKRQGIENLCALARPKLPITAANLDSHPHLFNCLNGTFDFSAGIFYEHKGFDFLTKRAEVVFNEAAPEPVKWLEFLAMVFDNDPEMIEYIQKIVGYSLTGLTDVQAVFFAYGTGANGKSAFFSVLSMLTGDYFQNIPVESILTRQQGAKNYDTAKLFGARAVTCNELPSNRSLNESLVKDLTGGEAITAERKYENPFTFKPTHKLFLSGNHRPVIRGTDEGIWRRIKLIPFAYTIPEEKRRPMTEVLAGFQAELSGILKWAIEGLMKYKAQGIEDPAKVRQATADYRNEQDQAGAFMEDQTEADYLGNVQLKQLYKDYADWCKSNEEFPVIRNSRGFADYLRTKGFKVENGSGNKMCVFGLKMRGEPNF